MRRIVLFVMPLAFRLSALAAGHDISAIRYVPPQVAGGVTMLYDGRSFVTAFGVNAGIEAARTDPLTGETSSPTPIGWFADPRKPYAISRWLSNGFVAVHPAAAPDDALEVTDLRTNEVVRVSHRAIAPRIARNGDRIVIADWSYASSNRYLSVSTFRSDGMSLATTTLPLLGVFDFDVASSGDGFVVATGGSSGVHLFRMDGGGAISDRLPLPGERPNRVSVAAGADRTVVAWTAANASGRPAAYVTSVSAAGETTPIEELPFTGASRYDDLRVVVAGAGYVVLFDSTVLTEHSFASFGTFAVRLDAAAHILDWAATKLTPRRFAAAAASADTIALAAPAGTPDGWTDVTVVTVAVRDSGLQVRTPLSSSIPAPVEQKNVKLASDGVDFVGVWQETNATAPALVAGRVSRSGDPLDGPGVKLPLNVTPYTNVDIQIARGAGGDALIVLAMNDRGLYAFRWSRAVGLLDAAPIVLSLSYATGAAVVWNGTRYLVVWTGADERGSNNPFELLGRFVGSDGSRSPVRKFSTRASSDWSYLSMSSRDPAVAWDGHQFLVAAAMTTYSWTEPGLHGQEIRLVRLSADGSPLDESSTIIPAPFASGQAARVASSGSEFLVALNDGTCRIVKTGPSGIDLGQQRRYFTLFDNHFAGCDVVWDGSAYVVAWTALLHDDGPSWLETVRVDRSGSISAGTYAPTLAPSDVAPSLAANDAGETAVALDEVTAQTQTRRARIYLAPELAPVPPPPAAPRNLVSHLAGTSAMLTWESDAADGFIVEALGYFTYQNVLEWRVLASVIDADLRRTTIGYVHAGTRIRIRSVGPGGPSADGPVTTLFDDRRVRSALPY